MSISASTAGVDAIIRSVAPKSLFESAKNVISSAVTWYQGDLLAFDTSGHLLKVVSTTADAANFCGIADNTVISGVLQGPYTGLTPTTPAAGDCHGPQYGVIANMKVLASDSLVPGCAVYLCDAADSQTVTVTQPGSAKACGIYQGPTATAAAGSRYPVLIGATYNLAGFSV